MGRIDGVYFYDQSALIRFVKDGSVNVYGLVGKDTGLETPSYSAKLRTPGRLVADELLREMDKPVQLRIGLKGWEIESTAIQVNDRFAMAFPEWRQRAVSSEEQLEAIGFGASEAKQMMHEIASQKGGMVKRAVNLALNERGVKQGRNERCNCGSGLKYKRCCGKS